MQSNQSGWNQTDEGDTFHAYGHNVSDTALKQAAQVIAILKRAEREHLSDAEIDAMLKELSGGNHAG